MEYTPQPLAILRAAFLSLQQSHPEMVTRLSAAMLSDSSPPGVESEFRDTAVALVPIDREAAETLFTVAEVIAQIALARLR
jgi:hypothetical protein